MALEIKGAVIQLLKLQSGMGSKGPWKKQEFVLETQSQYPKKACLSVWGDKVDQFQLRVGDVVTASIEIEAREYNGKFYNEIRCWKLDKHSYGPVVSTPSGGSAPANGGDFSDAASDDLPFLFEPFNKNY